MIFISENSFNVLYYNLLRIAYDKNIQDTDSRIGSVKDLGKVVYQIKNDVLRLCFLKERNINPFFVLTEFAWIIEGNNLVEPLQSFIKDYNKFSDDNKTFYLKDECERNELELQRKKDRKEYLEKLDKLKRNQMLVFLKNIDSTP